MHGMSSDEDKTRDVRAAIEALASLTEEDVDALIERMSEEELEEFKQTLAAVGAKFRNVLYWQHGQTLREVPPDPADTEMEPLDAEPPAPA